MGLSVNEEGIPEVCIGSFMGLLTIDSKINRSRGWTRGI